MARASSSSLGTCEREAWWVTPGHANSGQDIHDLDLLAWQCSLRQPGLVVAHPRACAPAPLPTSSRDRVLIPQIPGFGLYKLFNLARPILGMFLPSLFGPRAARAEGGAAPDQPEEKAESRKQAKLRARMEKGDKRVQQVQMKR